MRLSSEQISCRLMNICYLRSLFGYPNSMILYPLSEQSRPSRIRELGYNLEFPLSLITLARTVGLNDYKLKQGFQQVFNTTVFGYLQQQRLEKAKLLLQDSTLNVTAINRRVGYASPSAFHSAFKKHYCHQLGTESNTGRTTGNFLKLRFGDIDASLEGIIPALLQLSPDEYMDSLLQADREELLSRFQG